ncbi:MAG: cache domain-containing protein, partial [Pseudoflavonifractor sp.]
MKCRQQSDPDTRRTYFSIIATLVLLFAVVVFACFQYYNKLQQTVQEENAAYLQEISTQIGVNAGNTIEYNFSVLSTVAAMLEGSDVSTFAHLRTILVQQQQHWDFEHIMLIDESGVGYSTDGRTFLLSHDAYLQDTIVDRKRALSPTQIMDETECIVFALPLDNLTVDGIKMSALIATYSLDTFDQILSVTAFDGKGYGYIIRKDGTVVIRSSSPNAPQTGYNILSSLAVSSDKDARTVGAVRSDLAEGRGGQVVLTLDEVPLYMAYTPLDAQEWCLLTFVPVAVASEKSVLFLNITLLICAFITIAFLILIAVLLFNYYRHKQALERLAFVDPVTGGNTTQRFYTQAAILLAASGAPAYA